MNELNVTMDDNIEDEVDGVGETADRGDEVDVADSSGKSDESVEDDSEKDKNEDEDSDEDSAEDSDESGSEEIASNSTDENDPDEKWIPKYRFDQVNSQRKDLAKKIARYEERINSLKDAIQGDEFDFDTKEEEYAKALMEGEADKAKTIRMEIRAAEQKSREVEVNSRMALQAQQAAATALIDDFVLTVENVYPQLDRTSKTYDEKAYNEATLRVQMYAQLGYNPVDAIAEATQEVAARYKWQPNVVDNKSKKVAAKAVDVKQPKRTEAVGGKPSKSREVSKMSEAEFAGINERELKKLRGDYID